MTASDRKIVEEKIRNNFQKINDEQLEDYFFQHGEYILREINNPRPVDTTDPFEGLTGSRKMKPITLEKFNKLKIRDFENGAVIDEIRMAIKQRDLFARVIKSVTRRLSNLDMFFE